MPLRHASPEEELVRCDRKVPTDVLLPASRCPTRSLVGTLEDAVQGSIAVPTSIHGVRYTTQKLKPS